MSEQINEVAHGETAATGDAARRSSAEAAALTAGSTPSGQQSHSGSASRLSPKVKGGIIALLAASVLLVCVGAFALTGGFGGRMARLRSRLPKKRRLRSRVAQRRRRKPPRSRSKPNLRSIRKQNPILPTRTENRIPPLVKTLIRIQSLTATAAGYPRIPAAPQAAPLSLLPRRRAIPDRKLPAPEASSLLRRTSSPYRFRFPAAPSAIRFPPAGHTRLIPVPRPTMRCALSVCRSTRVAPHTEPTLPPLAGLPKRSTAEPPAGCIPSTAARP